MSDEPALLTWAWPVTWWPMPGLSREDIAELAKTYQVRKVPDES